MQWEQALKNYRRKVHEMPKAVIAETVREIGFRVIDRTPVLSGALVQNWRLAEGAQDSRIDTGLGPVRDQAKQKLLVKLARVNLLRALYFSNPVPYAYYIEYGRRKDGTRQTIPRAMVRLSVAEFQSVAASAMRKVKEQFK